VSDSFSGNSDAAVSSWLSANLSADELTRSAPCAAAPALFRRGELLALMPFSYVR
jgi:hypothetical protein